MTERRDDLADEEARRAAEEAGHIGGTPTYDLPLEPEEQDEAYRAVNEAGGGESEGFELAEEELIENADLGPGRPGAEVRVREGADDEEFDDDLAEYGEADSEDPEDL
jgi:hypothetical protein